MNRHGEAHHNAKITEADVRAMRKARADGATCEAVYLEFGPKLGLSYSQLHKILLRHSWKAVE